MAQAQAQKTWLEISKETRKTLRNIDRNITIFKYCVCILVGILILKASLFAWVLGDIFSWW